MNAALVIGSYYFFEHISAGIGRTAAFFILPISQAFMFTTIWVGFRSVFHHLRAFPAMFWLGFLGPIVGQLVIYSVPGVPELFHVRETSIGYMALFLAISTVVMIVFSLKQQYFGAKHVRSV
jgi:magnesium-transporting ATPase (P-type)